MEIINRMKEALKESNRNELDKVARQEATDFFNIELRNDKPCITFHNIIVNINNNHEDIVSILFDLRDRYYNDKINGIIK